MPVLFFWFQVMNLEIKTTAIEDSEIHSTLKKNTKVKFLCDIFPVVWVGLNGKIKFSMASLGDLFQFFATFCMVLLAIRYKFF